MIAVEPSAGMRAQRPAHLAPAIDARAEALPLDDGAVDAAMAIVTVHHWEDPIAGLRELRRVARGPVVVLTFDPSAAESLWLVRAYPPALAPLDRAPFPALEQNAAARRGHPSRERGAVPHDLRPGLPAG